MDVTYAYVAYIAPSLTPDLLHDTAASSPASNGSFNGGHGHQLRRPLPSTSSDRDNGSEDQLSNNDLRHKLKHRNGGGGGNQRQQQQTNIESGLQKLTLGVCHTHIMSTGLHKCQTAQTTSMSY